MKETSIACTVLCCSVFTSCGVRTDPRKKHAPHHCYVLCSGVSEFQPFHDINPTSFGRLLQFPVPRIYCRSRFNPSFQHLHGRRSELVGAAVAPTAISSSGKDSAQHQLAVLSAQIYGNARAAALLNYVSSARRLANHIAHGSTHSINAQSENYIG